MDKADIFILKAVKKGLRVVHRISWEAYRAGYNNHRNTRWAAPRLRKMRAAGLVEHTGLTERCGSKCHALTELGEKVLQKAAICRD